MNPYFGFRYKPVGLSFSSFSYQLTMMKFSLNDGSDPLLLRLLITRASCLLDLGEKELAFKDRRRLMIAAKIQVKKTITGNDLS